MGTSQMRKVGDKRKVSTVYDWLYVSVASCSEIVHAISKVK